MNFKIEKEKICAELEGTAGLVRALITNGLRFRDKKIFYIVHVFMTPQKKKKTVRSS